MAWRKLPKQIKSIRLSEKAWIKCPPLKGRFMVTTWVINPTIPGSNDIILRFHTSFSLSCCFSLFQSQGMWERRSLKLKYEILQRTKQDFIMAVLFYGYIDEASYHNVLWEWLVWIFGFHNSWTGVENKFMCLFQVVTTLWQVHIWFCTIQLCSLHLITLLWRKLASWTI